PEPRPMRVRSATISRARSMIVMAAPLRYCLVALIHVASRSCLTSTNILHPRGTCRTGSVKGSGDRILDWSLHDHDGAGRMAHYFFGHAAERTKPQPVAAVRPHNNQVASQAVRDLEDVGGAGLVGNDHFMIDVDVRIVRLKALKSVPQVCRIPLTGIGQAPATFRHDGRWLGDVEEDHLRSN